MPIAATQESSGATNVIGFSLAFVKWDIFLKDLTPGVIWLEVIYRLFLFKSKFPEKSFEIICRWIKIAQKNQKELPKVHSNDMIIIWISLALRLPHSCWGLILFFLSGNSDLTCLFYVKIPALMDETSTEEKYHLFCLRCIHILWGFSLLQLHVHS